MSRFVYRILATHPRIAPAYIHIRAAGYSSGGSSLSNRAERVAECHASKWTTLGGAERMLDRLRESCKGPFTDHWQGWSLSIEADAIETAIAKAEGK